MKKCTGCGRLDTIPLTGKAFACCPDNNYKELTAMQELIDLLETQKRLFIEAERHTLADGIGRTILLSKKFLEKEKEQILRAFELGMHECLAYDTNSINYYNQTYNQNK
jgi:hypothetical protein